jgi:hypothetical protein
MLVRKILSFILLAGFLLAFGTVVSGAEEASQPPVNPAIEQRALDLLADMSDYLAEAKTMTFTAKAMMEAQVNGQLLHFWSRSEVTLKRPNGLKILTQSDSKPLNIFFDGKTLSVLAPKDNMYAAIAAPATLDELIPFAVEKAGIMTNYYDILTSDPFAHLTDDLSSAFSAGQSTISGTLCDHLAFKGEDIEWEIWIATGDKPLPLMMTLTYLKVPDQPRFILHYSNWKLNALVAKGTFAFMKPAGAVKIEFQPKIAAALDAGGDKK